MKQSVILFVGVVIVIGGCKKNNIGPDKIIYGTKDTVTINFIGHWLDEGKKEQLLYELINEFEFLNQEIKINMKFPTIYAETGEAKFNAQVLLSPEPKWDIIRINNDLYNISSELKEPGWEKKYLVDFSEIEEFKKTTKPELLTEEAKSKFGGIMPGPGVDGYNWTLWCNIDIAKKAGIEVKQFDMTSDDFLTYLQAVEDYNNSHNDSIIPFFEATDWRTMNTIAGELFFSEIGDLEEIFNKSYSEQKIDAWEKVLNEIEKYSKYNSCNKNKNITWINHRFYPVQDKCLFFSNGTWMYNIWLKEYPDRVQRIMPSELPVFKPSPLTFGGYNITWAVPKNAPHREQAIKFLMFINRPDVAEKWSRYTKSPSGIKARMTDANFGMDRFENYQYMIEKKYRGNKIDLTSDSRLFFGFEFKNVPTYTDEVFSGIMTAKQAIQRIKAQIAGQPR